MIYMCIPAASGPRPEEGMTGYADPCHYEDAAGCFKQGRLLYGCFFAVQMDITSATP